MYQNEKGEMEKWISSPFVKKFPICFAASRSGEISHPFPVNLATAGKPEVLSCGLSHVCECAPENEMAQENRRPTVLMASVLQAILTPPKRVISVHFYHLSIIHSTRNV